MCSKNEHISFESTPKLTELLLWIPSFGETTSNKEPILSQYVLDRLLNLYIRLVSR